MKKLYICIGVYGSGSTSYVQSHLKDGEGSIVVPDIQAIKVFENDTDILYIDNDNLKRSTRVGLYNYCKHKGIEVTALCFLKPLATLIHNYNKDCGKSISEIIQDYKRLQVPRIGVDCDKIEKVYGNNFNEFRHEFLGNLPHDNSNHKESINEHIMMCVQNSPTLRLKEISKYHDLGKFICKEFVSKQLDGVLCRCYISVNNRNGSLVQKHLISYLALNDADLSKISRKTTSIAMLPQCAVTKKWLFDFDYESEEQVLEFVQDIKDINSTLEVEYKKTVHGYAVVTSHSFDTRALLMKWSDCENKKDGMLLIDWRMK